MIMIFRSLAACTILAGTMGVVEASAQVLLCPAAPPTGVEAANMPAEAERLLKRLTIALDLHGHRGISESAIIEAHVERPGELLARLAVVAERCTEMSGDVETFHAALPDLRADFLQATHLADASETTGNASHIKIASHDTAEAERLEQSIDLSVRELWRNLWFRGAEGDMTDQARWAVIVASPEDADRGWDKLGEHQRRWKDAYFQLHEPYYDESSYHAVVVGRRLPRNQAIRLRDFVIEMGMAEDAYIWPLPLKGKEEGG
jgi:hypothetical protein